MTLATMWYKRIIKIQQFTGVLKDYFADYIGYCEMQGEMLKNVLFYLFEFGT